MANRGRPVTIDHKNIPHRTIAMPDERRQALTRASAMLGVSSAVLIGRLIDAGLSVLNAPGEQA